MNAHRPRRSVSLVAALVLSSLATVLVLSPGAAAVTYVSGTISGPTTWGLPADDTYVLTANVTVSSSARLTILPGTKVRFDPGVTLYVDGSLYADGDAISPIDFGANDSAGLVPPRAIEFRSGSSGSVSFSTFDRFYTAVIANTSSPSITSNTVNATIIGFVLERSSSFVWGNAVRRAAIGIYASASDATIAGNSLNGTDVGVEILTSGSPTVSGNAITNVSSAFAAGIRVGAGTSPVIQGNWIYRVRGTNGGTPPSPGGNGTNGGFAIGVFVDSAANARIEWNSIDTVLGGNGGNGTANPSGAGGRGGEGGPAVGIVTVDAAPVDLISNTVTNVVGGRGGRGGGGGTTLDGGDGGNGGDAAAAFVVNATSFANLTSNMVDAIAGGLGGAGGAGAVGGSDGDGGNGGSAFALAVGNAASADVSGNFVSNIFGGFAGNGTAGFARGLGGRGGDALGLMTFPAGGFSLFHFNDVSVVTGGGGGSGGGGGGGGNATGVFGFGPDDSNFNQTTLTSNRIGFVSGGGGGPGTRGGGSGGLAVGFSVLRVRIDSASNVLELLQGGDGGDAGLGFTGGAGGDAAGFAAYLVPQALSTQDTVNGVTGGAPGAPAPPQASYGRGYYAAGNATITTSLAVENGTLTAIGDLDLSIENDAEGTTIATPFDETRISIMPAGNLTVMNYLRVDVFWPDGTTPVADASIRVDDNGLPIWDASSPAGSQAWILATDRVYLNSDTSTDNATDVTVTYPPYAFLNNPRPVDLWAAATESFVMVDSDAPTSAAGSLSAYTTSATFNVPYAASDGSGSGLRNITLWYRRDGGPWIQDGTQAAGNAGSFSFISSGDGVYEFATVANDTAGNEESFPAGNDTWTIVDTTRPGSRVTALGMYQTTASFVVSWGPDSGVTDIATYRIQYNRGAGWINWLVGTTATSQTFTADPAWGLYQFRSMATDAAGNVEQVTGNDTWTIVDTEPPESRVAPLTPYQTALTFTVSWGPVEDSFDIDAYRIEMNDNGGGWTVWLPATSATSADFMGVDGRRYEFRSTARDRAGNVESTPSGNDTWTMIDVTPPGSFVGPLPTYSQSLAIALTWGPDAGTTDIATYTIQVSDNGGAWTAILSYVDTPATSGSFTGLEGHRYAFRSIARDAAGNAEPAPSGNDTWTFVDTGPPFVMQSSPQGSGVDATPAVTITFSEAMDRTSVEQAFFISPSASGQFTWSADSRVLTFVPDSPLAGDRDYLVSIGLGAQDLAGNSLPSPYSFTFTTAASPPVASTLADLWWIFLAVGAAVGAAFLVVMRRRQTGSSSSAKAATPVKAESEAIIEDVFLLYHRDGILIKHETRRLRPEVDSDVLSGMLTAVQQFVKDALRGDEYAELNEMRVGHMHILIGRGKWLVLAARIEGDGSASWTQQIERCIKDMEDHQWDQLEDWDGDMALSRDLTPYVKKLIHGDYA